jgi:hypothetical protein
MQSFSLYRSLGAALYINTARIAACSLSYRAVRATDSPIDRLTYQAISSLGIAPPSCICTPIHRHSRLSFYSERVHDLKFLLNKVQGGLGSKVHEALSHGTTIASEAVRRPRRVTGAVLSGPTSVVCICVVQFSLSIHCRLHIANPSNSASRIAFSF